jgi:hypothetical protein
MSTYNVDWRGQPWQRTRSESCSSRKTSKSFCGCISEKHVSLTYPRWIEGCVDTYVLWCMICAQGSQRPSKSPKSLSVLLQMIGNISGSSLRAQVDTSRCTPAISSRLAVHEKWFRIKRLESPRSIETCVLQVFG